MSALGRTEVPVLRWSVGAVGPSPSPTSSYPLSLALSLLPTLHRFTPLFYTFNHPLPILYTHRHILYIHVTTLHPPWGTRLLTLGAQPNLL